MKKFSNESKERKEKRTKAIVKTVFKRYSFIVWLPILLFTLYQMGAVIFGFPQQWGDIWWLNLVQIVVRILCGVFIVCLAMICVIYCIIAFSEAVKSIIKYIKKRTILKDIKNGIFYMCKGLKKAVVYIVKIPIRICQRIKNEPQRFKDSLQKELDKEE